VRNSWDIFSKIAVVFIAGIFLISVQAHSESFHILLSGGLEVSAENPDGATLSLPYNGAAVIRMGPGDRFFRGVELEISAPQTWLPYRGSLAAVFYADIDRTPVPGENDLDGRRLAYDTLPTRIKNVYQIPVRASHGFRSGPYATVIPETALPSSFPVVFRLLPVIREISDDLENMRFTLSAKPILSDEGAVRIIPRYPEQLRNRPITVLIDDVIVENIAEERLLKEGNHHLVVLSNDYRNISRRFVVERAKLLNLTVDLQDPTPLIIFEGPGNARIFLNNSPVPRDNGPVPVEPGVYEAKFILGDYTLIKTITVQRGKTYRVALTVGIDIEEGD
jgi:hypothetical protein